MRKYEVDFKRLALLLLPTLLRRSGIYGVILAAVAPLSALHALFMQFRERTNYRLTHNGQVCYLRAALNDMFDPLERRIRIDDEVEGFGVLIVYTPENDRPIFTPVRAAGIGIMVNRRGFAGVSTSDFAVNIPRILFNIDPAHIKAMVDTYKLASKRYIIAYY